MTTAVTAPAPAAAASSSATATASAPSVTKAVEHKPSKFAGTRLYYGHGISALTLDKAAQPYYNPTWYQHLDLWGEYHVNELITFRTLFGLGQEFTLSDDTTYINEVTASDWSIEGGAEGVKLPFGGVKLSTTLRVVLPTSKGSQAATRLFTLGPSLTLAKKFDVAGGLMVAYAGRFNWRFHRATTGETVSPSIVSCGVQKTDACQDFFNTGVRNAWGDAFHGPRVVWTPNEKVYAVLFFYFSDSFLYAPSAVTGPAAASTQLDTSTDPGFRASNRFGGFLGWDFTKGYGLSLGFDTSSGQLGTDGRYRNPFFNQFTQLSLDLTVDVDEALSRIL